MSIQAFFIFLIANFSSPSVSIIKEHLGKTQTGMASYYASKFNGRKTYFGEIFNNQELTAAHPSLPHNTLIEVTNLSNNKKVTVRVNDRGPHTRNRVIDLSKSAARELGMVASGVAKVIVRVVGVDGLMLLPPSQVSPAAAQAEVSPKE
ncbi:septal ring lytic transglycosylase RlpA family protein [Arundinibacter roseus]|uniref:Probable endolytic peptidoglycan transglycosylase RlpA n=1 Tax=Arundinibacter roseus TaxID=2070510 RepID=A0A4R4K4K5_9BACT|nr:septal ring lytic transglycosylase RlpA family protein [Arundinibacter roseus]TDB61406.1 septal ring lytic transglycosylase RlpA family protein [Arundinibacter roseus]